MGVAHADRLRLHKFPLWGLVLVEASSARPRHEVARLSCVRATWRLGGFVRRRTSKRATQWTEDSVRSHEMKGPFEHVSAPPCVFGRATAPASTKGRLGCTARTSITVPVLVYVPAPAVVLSTRRRRIAPSRHVLLRNEDVVARTRIDAHEIPPHQVNERPVRARFAEHRRPPL